MKTGRATLGLIGCTLLIGMGAHAGEAAPSKVLAADETTSGMTRVSIVIDEKHSGDFLGQGETPLIYYWVEGKTYVQWDDSPSMLLDAESGAWYYDVPSDVQYFIIRDSGKQVQTIDIPMAANSINTNALNLTYPSDMVDPHLYLLSNDDGSYSVFANVDRQYSLTPEMVRYWVYRGDDTNSGKYFFHYESDTTGDTYVPASGYVEARTDGKYFAYFDLNYEDVLGKEYSLMATDDWLSQKWYETEKVIFEKGDNNKIHQRVYSAQDGLQHVEDYIATGMSLTAKFVGEHVLPAYFTCLNSDVNGYMAYHDLYSNFVCNDDGVWIVNGELSFVSLNDYSYVPGTESYDDFYGADNERNAEVTAWDKINQMGKLYNMQSGTAPQGASSLFSESQNVATITVGALIAMSMIGLAAFLTLRKKKQNRA